MLKQRLISAENSVSNVSAGKEKDEVSGRPKLWVPFVLQRSIIIVFLLSFLAVLATLVALFVYTQRQGGSLGIDSDLDRYYYLWTYGPTAGMECD